jgi:hypothetical protein
VKTLSLSLELAIGIADAGEITCQTEGRYTRCWDAQTGQTVSTTEHRPGSADHTWTPDAGSGRRGGHRRAVGWN